MKLLIVEYINSGGFIGHELPSSLLAEGQLMLQALLDDLTSLPELTLLLPLERRCQALALPENCRLYWLDEGASLLDSLPELIAECDAIWPIAPESDGILTAIAEMAEQAGKTLLLSSAEAVALCSDKLATFRALQLAAIPAVETVEFSADAKGNSYPCVLKPRDGAGCDGSYIVDDSLAYQQLQSRIHAAENYIRQPLIDGDAISLSCLFANDHAWLLTCNRQLIVRDGNGFRLHGCQVNVDNPFKENYRQLIAKIAKAIPGLWGYIGIDLIETADQGPLVLEINPRLTTSYAGIRQATGINVAELVLQLLNGPIQLSEVESTTVTVSIE